MNSKEYDERNCSVAGECKLSVYVWIKLPGCSLVEQLSYLGFVINGFSIYITRVASKLWVHCSGLIPYFLCCYKGNEGRKSHRHSRFGGGFLGVYALSLGNPSEVVMVTTFLAWPTGKIVALSVMMSLVAPNIDSPSFAKTKATMMMVCEGRLSLLHMEGSRCEVKSTWHMGCSVTRSKNPSNWLVQKTAKVKFDGKYR